MDIRDEESSASPVWYLLGGLIVGAAAGLLLAPQSGVETREDIEEWRQRGMEKARDLFARIGDSLPSRAKAGAVIGGAAGAIKGGAKGAVSSARENVKQFTES
jgi:gas vesicle protein